MTAPGPAPPLGADTRTPAPESTSEPARIIRPGAPGESGQAVNPRKIQEPPVLHHTPADVAFMQGMIPHHAQALEMAALVEERTENRAIRLLAQRIDISQRDEIALMTGWLRDRGEEAPGAHAHHMTGDQLMPGMLTPEDMKELAAGRGDQFDELFLRHMIRHHEGAVTMVETLFATPGAAQETELFTFASHVEADQMMEIRRMRQMLANKW